jgi:YggT family protein
MTQALHFLVESLGQLWLLTVLLRFFAQATRAPFRARAGNPLADFVMAVTDWAVMPLRRIMPPIAGLDTATFMLAWLGAAVLTLVLFTIQAGFSTALAGATFVPGLMVLALVTSIRLSIYLFVVLLIVQAVLSWISPFHPMRSFFDTLTRPLLRPMQRIVPLIGGVDLSPLFIILLLQVLLMVPIPWLGAHAEALMLGRLR